MSMFATDWRGKLQCDLVNGYQGRGLDAEVCDALARCRRIHLAIMREPWATYIADGSKRVESRWGKVRCAPHDDIDAGDVIAWKRTGGPVYGASCVTSGITSYLRSDDEVAAKVCRLADQIRIANDPTPYLGKRLLTLIRLGPFAPLARPIEVKQPGRAGWLIVHDAGTDGSTGATT